MLSNNMDWDYINKTMQNWLHNDMDYKSVYLEGIQRATASEEAKVNDFRRSLQIGTLNFNGTDIRNPESFVNKLQVLAELQ